MRFTLSIHHLCIFLKAFFINDHPSPLWNLSTTISSVRRRLSSHVFCLGKRFVTNWVDSWIRVHIYLKLSENTRNIFLANTAINNNVVFKFLKPICFEFLIFVILDRKSTHTVIAFLHHLTFHQMCTLILYYRYKNSCDCYYILLRI